MTNRNSPRGRTRRSRDLARKTEREQALVGLQLSTEKKTWGFGPPKKAITPCLGCGKRERRTWDKAAGAWVSFCFRCWDARGQPSMEESRAMGKAITDKLEQDEREQRDREVSEGKRPW